MYVHVDAALKLNKLTRADLAKAMGLAPSTMSLKLNAKAPITLSEAKSIKSILRVDKTLEELFSDTA